MFRELKTVTSWKRKVPKKISQTCPRTNKGYLTPLQCCVTYLTYRTQTIQEHRDNSLYKVTCTFNFLRFPKHVKITGLMSPTTSKLTHRTKKYMATRRGRTSWKTRETLTTLFHRQIWRRIFLLYYYYIIMFFILFILLFFTLHGFLCSF